MHLSTSDTTMTLTIDLGTPIFNQFICESKWRSLLYLKKYHQGVSERLCSQDLKKHTLYGYSDIDLGPLVKQNQSWWWIGDCLVHQWTQVNICIKSEKISHGVLEILHSQCKKCGLWGHLDLNYWPWETKDIAFTGKNVYCPVTTAMTFDHQTLIRLVLSSVFLQIWRNETSCSQEWDGQMGQPKSLVVGGIKKKAQSWAGLRQCFSQVCKHCYYLMSEDWILT